MHGQNINLPVCVSVCVCVRHTFCQLAYRSDPSTYFFTVDSLKDADLYARMCLSGVSMMNNHISGAKSANPPLPILGTWVGISSQICEKFK